MHYCGLDVSRSHHHDLAPQVGQANPRAILQGEGEVGRRPGPREAGIRLRRVGPDRCAADQECHADQRDQELRNAQGALQAFRGRSPTMPSAPSSAH
jgi:hypothetical protein